MEKKLETSIVYWGYIVVNLRLLSSHFSLAVCRCVRGTQKLKCPGLSIHTWQTGRSI